MQLTFLSAAIPLTKTISYSERDDKYTVAPYPMVSRVTSHEVQVNNMLEFATAIRQQGQQGRCLMFGQLDGKLTDESRAGRAVEAPHEWICFDFDKVDCPPTIEGALAAVGKYLPGACATAECVIQLSPSCYHPEATRLSAHVFFRLAEPVASKVLKEWITRINFDKLNEGLKLTDSGNALSFPLDRCVTDASRLLYISPPKTVGFKSPVSSQDAIIHIKGSKAITVPHFEPVSREELNSKINALRKTNLLPERDFRSTRIGDLDILLEPGECLIHDVRASGDGYIRFNINGGNSLAYWINLRQPQLIGNFKGEPYMYTKEANEQFFKALTKSLQAMPHTNNSHSAMEVLAFYATNRGSAIYIGTYDRVSDKLRVERSFEGAAYSWLKQYGVPITPLLPHYDLTYDISSDIRYEEGYPVINMYERTNFIKEFSDAPRVLPLTDMAVELSSRCPTIFKTIQSCAGDKRSALGLINWLAYIFQTRKKTGTAWLLHGVEGTGKGMLVNHICKPLFGQSNVVQMLMNNIDSRFNSLLEGKLIVNVDETEMSRSRDKVEAMAKIRNWVTEPMMIINEKNAVEREVESFCNFIFSSNSMRPLILSESDRRMHVGTRQEIKLQYMPNEIAILEQGEELPAFAQLLGKLEVDEEWVRNPDKSEQKTMLFESSHSLLDRVGFAIKNGDTRFFIEARPSELMRQASSNNSLLPMKQYDDLLRAMLDGTCNVLNHEDLFVLYHVVVNDTRIFSENPTFQKTVYARYGLVPKGKEAHRCKRRNKVIHGIKAPEWQEVSDFLLQDTGLRPSPQDNIIPMKRK